MYAVYIALSAVFIVISLRPLKEASAYRFQKMNWTLLGFALLGVAVANLWLQEFWMAAIGGVLVFPILKLKYD